jgi:hypothetical protein
MVENGHPDAFVVIDDDSIPEFGNFWVRTDHEVGLTALEADSAISILRKKEAEVG